MMMSNDVSFSARMESVAASNGNRALMNLVKYDIYDNIYDLYISMARETGLWNALSGDTKKSFIKKSIQSNDPQWIFETLEFIGEMLDYENDKHLSHLTNLSIIQQAKFKKNRAIRGSFATLKTMIKKYNKFCSIKTIVHWLDISAMH